MQNEADKGRQEPEPGMPGRVSGEARAEEPGMPGRAYGADQAFEYLKAVTDNAFSYAIILDPEGIVLYYSDSLLSLASIASKSMYVGVHILDGYKALFSDKDFVNKATLRFARIMSGEKEFYEDDVVSWPNGEKSIYRITYKRIQSDTGGFDGILIYTLDITNIQLEEANRRMNDLLYSAALPCLIWDEDGRIIAFNKEAVSTFDIPEGLSAVEFNNCFFSIEPEFQADGTRTEYLRRQVLDEAVRKGFSQVSVMLSKRDGTPIWFTVNTTRITWLFGYRLVVHYYDQTEIMIKDAEAREAESRMKLMLDTNPLMCVMRDDKGNIIDCNQAALNILGVPDKDDFCRNFYSFFPEYQPDGSRSDVRMTEIMEILQHEGSYHFNRTFMTRSGELIPAETQIVRIPWRNSHYYLSFSSDLREYERLMRNEEESRILMNKATAILENVDTLISITDLDFNLLYMNQNMASVFGLNRDECIGRKCYEAIRNQTEPCSICRLPGLLPDKESLPSQFDEYLWDDVLGIWTETKASIIRWVDDSLVFFHSINDQSVKKAYEDEMRKAMEASIAASASKTAFLANMSHEVRTPMNSIIGFAELALDGSNTPETAEFLGKIIQSAKWLLHIINDILDISKIESGKMEMERVPFDLNDIFESCRSSISPLADDKGLALHFHTEPLPGRRLIGDPVRLYQSLINLLSNAVKFTNQGSIRLSSGIELLDDESVSVFFEVEDSGIGMDTAQIGKIFEPFMQADTSITRNYGGTGLGLAITVNYIEMMGGRLEVESAPGVGSKFSFTLIFETIGASDLSPGLKEYHTVKKPHFDDTVLLCEDNKMNQEVIVEHLNRVGIKTVIAENGKAGVDVVTDRIKSGEKPFGLIFMDIHMPVMNGVEAAGLISALGTDTPIVAMTANIMTSELDEYKESGMRDTIGKPFTSQELWRMLLKYLTPLSVSAVDEADRAQDDVLRRKLSSSFARSYHMKRGEVAEAIDSGDLALAHRLAHTMSSNAGFIGEDALRKAASEVETALGRGTTPSKEQITALENELKTVLEGLMPLLEESEATAGREDVDDAQILELYKKLEPMLEALNPECVNLLGDIRAVPGTEDLARQIEDYDFESAMRTLAELKRLFRGESVKSD